MGVPTHETPRTEPSRGGITAERADIAGRDAIDAWKHSLDRRCGLDRRQRLLVRETISRDLPCRDAVVCACMDPSLPLESLERIACDPQDDRALRDLARTLDSAFTRRPPPVPYPPSPPPPVASDSPP
ncbi:hypothetical protein, partial [Bifidobacterium xylocopae]